MAKSLSRIMDQIDRLQQEAAAIQGEVIGRIRKEIAKYGLTAEQLFGDAPKGKRHSNSRSSTKSREPKYGDANGNVWGGIGKRPEWLRQALSSGQRLDDFLLVQSGAVAATPKTSRKKAGKAPAPKAQAASKTPATKKSTARRRASAAASSA